MFDTPQNEPSGEAETVPTTASSIVVPEIKAEAASQAKESRKPVRSASKIDPFDFPDPPASSSDGVRCTLDNLAFLLEAYDIKVSFNVMKKRLDIDIPGLVSTDQNRDQVVLNHIENLAIKHRMSAGRVAANLLTLGDTRPFDPMAEWIDSKPWDGEDRLPAVYATVVPQEGYPLKFRDTLMKKWLLSVVAATFVTKGFRARGALTFQGAQGIGKTSWFKRLVSDPALRDQAIKLGPSWDGGSKDAKLAAVRHRIVELGELEGSFRREIASLKAFMTEDYDKIRPPYARVEAEYPRQTIFGASVNESDFLLDHTGNSRFLTVAVESLDYQHNIDMQQVFAQLKVDFLKEEKWWLSDEEDKELETINRRHRYRNAVAEKIEDGLDLALVGQNGLCRDSATDVLRKIGIERPTNPQFKEANAILRELLGQPKKINGSYRWYVPWARIDPKASDLKSRPINSVEEVY